MEEHRGRGRGEYCLCLMFCLLGFVVSGGFSVTDPNDLAILREFEKGLENSELLNWPGDNDPCGSKWPHVFCSGDRVSQIQVQNMGLKGPLPKKFNGLSKLYNLGFQRNKFTGSLPTFSGLSDLVYAYLNDNEFDSIPSDFFTGLTSLQALALDNNPLNATTGWTFPTQLENAKQMVNLSFINCNLVGELPDFVATFESLIELKLAFNRLSGGIPASFANSVMQVLWLNGQNEVGLSGSINVIAYMIYLRQLWLHGNHFTGVIPDIGNLTSLRDLNLNGNQLVGVISPSLATLDLVKLDLNNNMLMGPIPKFKLANITYDNNHFCQSVPGAPCSPDVTALLAVLAAVNYPSTLVSQWSGNNPCSPHWVGINCDSQMSKIIRLSLPKYRLNGTLSPSVSNLESVLEIKLGGNNLSGPIPDSLTGLKSLNLLDLSDNNFEPPLPKFRSNVRVVLDGNPRFVAATVSPPPSPDAISPPGQQPSIRQSPPPTQSPPPPTQSPPPPTQSPPPPHIAPPFVNPPFSPVPGKETPSEKRSNDSKLIIIVSTVAGGSLILIIAIFVVLYRCKATTSKTELPLSVVVHPKDPSDHQNAAKVTISTSATGTSSEIRNSFWSGNSSGFLSSRGLHSGNVISIQILRKVTDNFSRKHELGRGGFGVVYKGMLEDGTQIAVKRMEAGVLSNNVLDEFQSEIRVLSKVRHRHLVSLLGYSIEGNERLLVYEYMSQGALSRHLFHWQSLKLEPLSWARRLGIALDVARGVEYLHGLARESFIHRDLKSSNILLGDDFRAKVSDFGLVKLAPGLGKSIATRLAGTFGYLAPEYAVMGRITTKSDVFSFGVVLMELLTGLTALDENRPEDTRYLAQWFSQIKSNKEKLMEAMDKTLGLKTDDSIEESISIVAELAGHCTARDPNHRPDMGYAVTVLAPLVEKWQPVKHESDDCSGINYDLALPEMLKGWRENDGRDMSLNSVDNSQGSLPSRPVGFADSFTSIDGR
ncbi:unnamed protein product [Rhodiola kirilowii]